MGVSIPIVESYLTDAWSDAEMITRADLAFVTISSSISLGAFLLSSFVQLVAGMVVVLAFVATSYISSLGALLLSSFVQLVVDILVVGFFTV